MNTVLIIDDHEIVRVGLKLLIGELYRDCLVDEAADGDKAVSLLKMHPYDLVILDIILPQTNTLELLQYICKSREHAKVLVFSMNSEMLYGKRLLQLGAFGYLCKESSMEEVRKAISAVLSGRRYVSERLMEVLVGEMRGHSDPDPFSALSSREFEITGMLLKGLSISQIAEQAHLDRSTVETYKARIFRKLKVGNLLELKEVALLFQFR